MSDVDPPSVLDGTSDDDQFDDHLGSADDGDDADRHSTRSRLGFLRGRSGTVVNLVIAVALLLVVALIVWTVRASGNDAATDTDQTATVSTGDVTATVSANGNVAAATTVNADFQGSGGVVEAVLRRAGRQGPQGSGPRQGRRRLRSPALRAGARPAGIGAGGLRDDHAGADLGRAGPGRGVGAPGAGEPGQRAAEPALGAAEPVADPAAAERHRPPRPDRRRPGARCGRAGSAAARHEPDGGEPAGRSTAGTGTRSPRPGPPPARAHQQGVGPAPGPPAGRVPASDRWQPPRPAWPAPGPASGQPAGTPRRRHQLGPGADRQRRGGRGGSPHHPRADRRFGHRSPGPSPRSTARSGSRRRARGSVDDRARPPRSHHDQHVDHLQHGLRHPHRDKSLQVTADVAEADIADVEVGQPATVTLSATGASMDGTVTAVDTIETVTNNVVEYGVTVTLDEAQGRQARPEHPGRDHDRFASRASCGSPAARSPRSATAPRRPCSESDGTTAPSRSTTGLEGDGFTEVLERPRRRRRGRPARAGRTPARVHLPRRRRAGGPGVTGHRRRRLTVELTRLHKVYGAGRDRGPRPRRGRPADRARRLRRGHGGVRLGQVDADEHHRLPRRRDRPGATCSTASTYAGSTSASSRWSATARSASSSRAST